MVFVMASGGLACGTESTSRTDGNASAIDHSLPDTVTIDHVVRTDDRFSILARALDSTGLDSTLRGPGPYTLFAPPNSAFDALPEGTVPILFNERLDQLRKILQEHVVTERVAMADRSAPWTLETLGGNTLRLTATDTTVVLRNAKVIDSGIETSNGLIHVVDAVLQPAAEETEEDASATDP